MIKLLKDLPEVLFEIIQIHDHAVHGVNLALQRNFNDIIMAMRIFVVAGAENLLIFGFIPFGVVVAMGCAEFEAFCQGGFGHHKWPGMKKGQDFGLKLRPKSQPLWLGNGEEKLHAK